MMSSRIPQSEIPEAMTDLKLRNVNGDLIDKLELIIHSLSGTTGLAIAPVNFMEYQFFVGLLSNFGTIEDGVLKLDMRQKATPELKEKIKNYVAIHSQKTPQINKLHAWIKNIPDNEWFMLAQSEPTDASQKVQIETYLEAMNQTEGEKNVDALYEELISKFDKDFGAFFSEYSTQVLSGERRRIIGAKQKNSRQCRFCGGKFSDGVPFTKIAHAIPESLGNKTIILGDECDVCNKYFGDNVEPHLIEFLNIPRVFLGVKGSSGSPKIKFENCATFHQDGTMVIVAPEADALNERGEDGFSIDLKSSMKFVPKLMLKALCKISLSTIGDDLLPHFKATINWLRYDNFPDMRVAKVATCVNNDGFTRQPQIVNYVRKTNNFKLPHLVSEFRLGSWVYVYIIPFSDRDECSFTDDVDFDSYWKFFDHYKTVEWNFISVNSMEARSLTTKIRINRSASL